MWLIEVAANFCLSSATYLHVVENSVANCKVAHLQGITSFHPEAQASRSVTRPLKQVGGGEAFWVTIGTCHSIGKSRVLHLSLIETTPNNANAR